MHAPEPIGRLEVSLAFAVALLCGTVIAAFEIHERVREHGHRQRLVTDDARLLERDPVSGVR